MMMEIDVDMGVRKPNKKKTSSHFPYFTFPFHHHQIYSKERKEKN